MKLKNLFWAGKRIWNELRLNLLVLTHPKISRTDNQKCCNFLLFTNTIPLTSNTERSWVKQSFGKLDTVHWSKSFNKTWDGHTDKHFARACHIVLLTETWSDWSLGFFKGLFLKQELILTSYNNALMLYVKMCSFDRPHVNVFESRWRLSSISVLSFTEFLLNSNLFTLPPKKKGVQLTT